MLESRDHAPYVERYAMDLVENSTNQTNGPQKIQINLKQLLLAVACLAVAFAILGQSIHSGDYSDKRGPLWFAFVMTHPHFIVALSAATGALFGRFWTGLVIGVVIPIVLGLLFFGLLVAVGGIC